MAKIRHGLVIAYSPSGVSQIIAQSIMQAPAKKQKKYGSFCRDEAA
jgi:hypothetical protein